MDASQPAAGGARVCVQAQEVTSEDDTNKWAQWLLPPSLSHSQVCLFQTFCDSMMVSPWIPSQNETVIECFSRLTLWETGYMKISPSVCFDTRPAECDRGFVFICMMPFSDTSGFFSIHLHHFSSVLAPHRHRHRCGVHCDNNNQGGTV
jgi:hypothetical protein